MMHNSLMQMSEIEREEEITARLEEKQRLDDHRTISRMVKQQQTGDHDNVSMAAKRMSFPSHSFLSLTPCHG